jgi:hypothetical protein
VPAWGKNFPRPHLNSWVQCCAPVTPAILVSKLGRSRFTPAWAKSEILFLQNNQRKRVGGVTEVVECMPVKQKVLSSNPSVQKKKKKKKKKKKTLVKM